MWCKQNLKSLVAVQKLKIVESESQYHDFASHAKEDSCSCWNGGVRACFWVMKSGSSV